MTTKPSDSVTFNAWLKNRLSQLNTDVRAPQQLKDRIKQSLRDAS